MTFRRSVCLAFMTMLCSFLYAENWQRFRGPNGSGVAEDDAQIPTQWAPNANLRWKTAMPGPGVSSPIVVGNRVFVTCYSGYGLSQEDPGQIENLMRHVVCVDLETGEPIWQRDVKAALPEDAYTGIGVTAHGYASHTPVSDGQNVYAFLGKSGVHAFDLDGNPLWNASVGMESDPTKWGSSSSPVIFENIIIVTASAESQSIIGYDKDTGKELWRQEAKGLDGMWGTPALVKVDDSRTDLVMCVAKELWGLDPSTGKMRWFAEATGAEQAHASVVVGSDRVFAFTGRGGGSVSVKAGGTGDISDSNTLWTGTETSSFSSPVGYQSKLYVIARGVLTVVDGLTGDKLQQVRLQGAERSGGRFGSLDYPSPIVVGDHLYYLNGSGQMFVFDLAGDEVKQIAVNKVTGDKESFGGSPAVSQGCLLLRSEKNLYCVTDKGEGVVSVDNRLASQSAEAAGPASRAGRPGGAGAGGRPGGGFGGGRPGGSGRPGGGGGAPGRGGQWDPMSLFNDRDADKDGKLSESEIASSPMAARMAELDKDGDKAISAEEFRSGMSGMFGGGRGGNRGGGRGGNWGGRGEDNRPERPQRPAMASS